MKKRDATDYLKDILEAIDEVETFIDDLTYDEFITDRKTLNAVVRSIEVIGEAATNIPQPLKENPIFFAKQALDFTPFDYQEKLLNDPSPRIIACMG